MVHVPSAHAAAGVHTLLPRSLKPLQLYHTSMPQRRLIEE